MSKLPWVIVCSELWFLCYCLIFFLLFYSRMFFLLTLGWMVKFLFIDYGDVIFSKAWPVKQPLSCFHMSQRTINEACWIIYQGSIIADCFGKPYFSISPAKSTNELCEYAVYDFFSPFQHVLHLHMLACCWLSGGLFSIIFFQLCSVLFL